MQIVHYSGKTQRKCPPALLLFCSVLWHTHTLSLPTTVELNRTLTLNIMFVFVFSLIAYRAFVPPPSEPSPLPLLYLTHFSLSFFLSVQDTKN